jgi:acyl-CoA synthetase (AMP-forming)/AMP-acid ligase II
MPAHGAVNVAAFLPQMAARQPYTPAIVFPHGRDRQGRVAYTHFTYRQLDQESDLIAAGLEQVGVTRGMRTVLMVRPSLELFALTFAMFKAGVVPVMVDPGIGLPSLKACLGRAEPEAFIGIPEAHAARTLFGWSRSTIRITITAGRRWFWGGLTLDQVKAAGRRASGYRMAPTRAEEMAAILFTSGSTGPPKGAVYCHGNFAAQVESIRDMYQIEPGEVDLPTFPLFALFDPALGMTTIVPDMDPTRPAGVNPLRIIEAVNNFGVTNMFGSPALLNTVGRYGAANQVKLPSIRRVISAGAPVPATVIERFLTMLGADALVHTPYGATESLPVATTSSREVLGETRQATDAGHGVCVGRPVSAIQVSVIGITDDPIPTWDDSLLVPDGEVGEIVVRGPMVTRSYYNADDKTRLAKIYDAEGDGLAHRMGDLGYFDDQGRLWFCGRKSHRVITEKETMYTVPCEAVFNTHESVHRTALVAVSRDGVTEPVLCVELEPEVTVDRKRLTGELLEIGAAHEHTRQIHTLLFHPGFPVDIRHNTKIGREKLAVWAAGELA